MRSRNVIALCSALLLGCGEVHETIPDAGPDPVADAGADAAVDTVDAPPIETCTPDQFVDCDGTSARICNATGDGVIATECGAAGCNATAGRCNACVPDSATCAGNTVQHCTADGALGATESCTLGCGTTPSAHCKYIEPRYDALQDSCDALATLPSLVIDTNQSFDTAADILCTGGVRTQTSGPEICVVRYGAITISGGRTLKVTGPRAIALVADRAVTIDGVLDVSADGTTNGPGGGLIASGGKANTSVGGGGAGFRTAGGNGGSDTADGGGAPGGAPSTNPADLVSLVGGPRPQIPTTIDADPGGGGGALTVIACRGAVTVSATGVIDAGGGGGRPGFDQIFGGGVQFTSGAGGGAGGNIVLQGAAISVLGQIFANGGGGGGGTAISDTPGQPGDDGLRLATTSASGGAGAGVGGAGGAGGRQGVAPTPGLMPGSTGATPGGGGGSVGFAQTYTPSGVAPVLQPSAASPAFNGNRTINTR
ncbi:MAG TPA: hypothetical protein VFQ53_17415 [Kofleriaceae bacterium]|nr:hypothetical protein [Kofleriaceae bacterium]